MKTFGNKRYREMVLCSLMGDVMGARSEVIPIESASPMPVSVQRKHTMRGSMTSFEYSNTDMRLLSLKLNGDA